QGMDEIAVTGSTSVAEVRDGVVTHYELTPGSLGLPVHPEGSLRGGAPEENARIVRDVLGGQRGAPRDAVLANAAAALYVGGAVTSLADGVQRAARSIDSGAAQASLERLVATSRELRSYASCRRSSRARSWRWRRGVLGSA